MGKFMKRECHFWPVWYIFSLFNIYRLNPWILLNDSLHFHEKLLHLIKLVEFTIAKACWTVCFLAVGAWVAIFVGRHHSFASKALASGLLGVLNNHRLIVLVAWFPMLLHTLILRAKTKTLFLSSVQNKLVSQILDNIKWVNSQLVNIEVLNALMSSELTSGVFLITDLTHNLHFWAVSFDVVIQVGTSHMLILVSVADIATKFWAVELGVGLQLT